MMRFRPRLRLHHDGPPGAVAWTIAILSLILPVAGLVLCGAGLVMVSRAVPMGWAWLGAGTALIALDIVIDVAWAHPAVSRSDLPLLNRRADQLKQRT
jgi:membrane protein implicated in regulation of membrane protease activity